MMDHRSRQNQFQQTLADDELDGFVVTHPRTCVTCVATPGAMVCCFFSVEAESSSPTAATPSKRVRKYKMRESSSLRARFSMKPRSSLAA